MSGIPDDIKKAAERVVRRLPGLTIDEQIEAVGREILIERERFARVVKQPVDAITKAILAGRL